MLHATVASDVIHTENIAMFSRSLLYYPQNLFMHLMQRCTQCYSSFRSVWITEAVDPAAWQSFGKYKVMMYTHCAGSRTIMCACLSGEHASRSSVLLQIQSAMTCNLQNNNSEGRKQPWCPWADATCTVCKATMSMLVSRAAHRYDE